VLINYQYNYFLLIDIMNVIRPMMSKIQPITIDGMIKDNDDDN